MIDAAPSQNPPEEQLTHTEQMTVTDATASANSQLHVKESQIMF